MPIQSENQTLATITYQNFFRMYKKLGGMTGTAATEAEEFLKIYNLEVTTIPTNRAMVRTDHQDVIYKTEKEKFDAVMAEIRQNHEEGRPVLVGTVSVHKSEIVHQLLEEAGVPHNVLNAKQHDREAEIIAQAGRLGAVTIATNMAGRGTDILLGGNPEVMARVEVREMQFPEGLSPEDLEKEREAAYEKALRKYRAQCDEERKKVVGLGGLHIVGTERHEARRIDNQLRGRAGRQGDPGSSHFFLSLEDDLMRIFGGDKLRSLMTRLGMQEGEPIEHPLVTSSIERAQKRVEARNFDIRKHLLEYDDVMNSQRSTIYKLRREVLGGVQVHERIIDLIEDAVIEMADQHCSPRIPPTEWAVDKLEAEAAGLFAFKVDLQQFPREREKYEDAIFDEAVRRFEEKENKYTKELVGQVSQVLYLRTIDQYWKDHLLAMDHLREGIGLRGYGQKDPKQEYKKEGYNLFLMTLRKIRIEVLGNLFRLEVRTEEEVRAMEAAAAEEHEKQLRNAQLVGGGPPPDAAPQPETPANVQQIRLTPRSASRSAAGREEDGGGAPAGGGVPVKNLGRKIGRNEDCPCGSGKKYKKCCALDNIEYFQGADGAWVDQSGNPPARAGGGTQATGT
ncbi:MAG: Protein translocase subunit SecA [Myxococcota bacterium]|nr:Protein translocase subunit SecA [Myxococcota bacterium]